jgi:hypothetical protein
VQSVGEGGSQGRFARGGRAKDGYQVILIHSERLYSFSNGKDK